MVDGKEVKIPATIEDETVLYEIENILFENNLIYSKTMPKAKL